MTSVDANTDRHGAEQVRQEETKQDAGQTSGGKDTDELGEEGNGCDYRRIEAHLDLISPPIQEPLLRKGRRSGGRVQKIADLFAGLECSDFLRRHRDGFSGTRIAALPGCLVIHFESAETANVDPLARLQGFGHGGEQGVDDLFALLLVEFG